MKLQTLDRPAAAAAAALVADAAAHGWLVTLLGRCTVDYDGRATSHLGPGDRLVVAKPDGAVLVHAEDGRTPVNWQPPGSDWAARAEAGALVVESTRTSPDEELVVRFGEVYLATALDAEDGADLRLAGTEADLRERVLADPSLVEDGLVPEATERATAAGSADVVCRDADGCRVVLELKRRRVGPGAVAQLRRYVDAIERETGDPVRGILVSPSVTDGGRDLLDEHGLDHAAVAPPSGDRDGGAAADRRTEAADGEETTADD